MQELYFLTSNDDKLKEVEAILGLPINKISLDLNEIQTLEVAEVVKDKAKRAFEQIKKPVFIEDTGLYITALNGFPGALYKWVFKTIGNDGICQMLLGKNREAIAKTCVGLYDGQQMNLFMGEIRGTISEKPLGTFGFGWDPIFIPSGFDQTFAELGLEIKNKVSMRRLALSRLKEFLEQA